MDPQKKIDLFLTKQMWCVEKIPRAKHVLVHFKISRQHSEYKEVDEMLSVES